AVPAGSTAFWIVLLRTRKELPACRKEGVKHRFHHGESVHDRYMTPSQSVAGHLGDSLASDVAVETARADLSSQLDLVHCSFEPWPFDALLPRIEYRRIMLPADVVGARSYAAWKPEDGIELPVRIRGLQLGRFVLVARTATTGVAIPISSRDRALDIADRCATVLAARLTEGVCSWST
ncbi:MAG: hypothetical protein M3Q30_23810, partial [Actinomycetota bacterium]|nr:hypothetical protein [Actinomycetota bacterium]